MKDLTKIRKEILEFSRKTFPGEESREWTYFQNNYVNHPDKKSPKYTAIFEGGKMIGFLGYIPMRLKIGKVFYKSGWQLDQFVSEEKRGKGIGRKILNEAYSLFDINLAIKNSEDAIRIYTKQGWKYHSIPLYLKIISFRSYLPRFLEKVGLVYVLDKVYQTLFCNKESELDFERFGECGEELREVWKKNSKHYSLVNERDRDYLNWKFKNYEKYYVINKGTIEGYIILKTERKGKKKMLSIIDFFMDPNKKGIINSVINFLNKKAIDVNADVIRFYISDKRLVKLFRKQKFIKREDDLRLMYYSKKHLELNRKYEGVLVTLYDSDGEPFFYKEGKRD